MPIGDGPDIEQFNREGEKSYNLSTEVVNWWYGLQEEKKEEIMENWLNKGIVDPDEEWEKLPWSEQLEIYNEEGA